MWHILADLLGSKALQLRQDLDDQTFKTEGTGDNPDFGQFLCHTSQFTWIESIAVASTNLIRNSGNYSDNRKATSFSGDLVNQRICYFSS